MVDLVFYYYAKKNFEQENHPAGKTNREAGKIIGVKFIGAKRRQIGGGVGGEAQKKKKPSTELFVSLKTEILDSEEWKTRKWPSG